MTEPTPDTAKDRALLQTLARSDPDLAASSAHSGAFAATALADAAGLAQATVAVLRADPDPVQRLDQIAQSPALPAMDPGWPVAEATAERNRLLPRSDRGTNHGEPHHRLS